MATKVKTRRRKSQTSQPLHDVIIESIQDKKGEEIVSLDLREIPDTACDFFIICHASVNVQIKAIADHIIEKVRERTGKYPHHCEGFQHLEWVLIDYVDIVVHVFQQQKREFYQLEELWADATKQHIN